VDDKPPTNWENTSSPKVVVPNQYSAEGGEFGGPAFSFGVYFAITGPMIAKRIKNRRILKPILNFVLRKAK
jgi:hypothetical protein